MTSVRERQTRRTSATQRVILPRQPEQYQSAAGVAHVHPTSSERGQSQTQSVLPHSHPIAVLSQSTSTTLAQPLPVLTPLRLVNAVLRLKRWIIGGAIVCAIVAMAVSALRESVYVSNAAILPQTRSPTSNLSGIASQLGLSLPAESGTQQPAFYVELLTSDEMLRRVASSRFMIAGDRIPRTLVDIYEPGEADKSVALELAMNRLRKAIGVSLSAKSGIVYTSLSAASPELARALNQRLLQQADSFNRANRRGQAFAERQFADERLREAGSDLRDAENRLQGFLEANREYHGSPLLSFQQDRLSREVTTRNQLYASLVQAREQARIQEVRDMPIFSELQAPTLPPHAAPRHVSRNAVLGLALGAILGLVIGHLIFASRQSPEFPSDLEEFRQLRAGRTQPS